MYYYGTNNLNRFKYNVESVLPPKARRGRLIVLFTFAILWSCALAWRLFSLQISNFETWQDWALKQHFQDVQLSSERGPIYDREGRLMAVSVPAGSVFLRPKQIKDPKTVAQQLAGILSIKPAAVMQALASKQPFVWLQRQIPRSQAEKVTALKSPGVNYVLESRRIYPYNHAASTLVGKVGIDGIGLSGVESVYEKYLHGEKLNTRMVRDAFGNMIDVSLNSSSPKDFELPKGNPLTLTIDADIQMIVDEELEAGRVAANAQHGMAVMVDAESGEVLAMSQAPTTNFNKTKLNPKKDLKNIIVETIFEPGSIFKPIVAAAAIEEGAATPKDMINCENGRFPFSTHVIKDVHPSGTISFRDVMIRSSNIGMTKVGMRLGQEKLYSYLRKFGFGEASLNLLPGETKGILRPVSSWAKVDVATHSFGQGIAITPLQLLRATAAIANGGTLPNIHVIKDEKSYANKRIISEDTAAKVRDMMYGVVTDPHGTGKAAEIPGVQVGGKTGTAQKARNGGRGYLPGAYMSSFVGFVDGSVLGVHKTLALIVIMDEPKAKSIYGGVVSAPVFKRIMQRSLNYLTTKQGIQDKLGNSKEILANHSASNLRQVAFVRP